MTITEDRLAFFKEPGTPGAFTSGVLAPALDLPGFTNVDDLTHFHLVLSTQELAGVRGDMLELGPYFGRAATVLARHLRPGERLVACDVFDLPKADRYAQTPTPEGLRRAVLDAAPGLRPEQLDVRRCSSSQLDLAPGDRFRFIHVDGDHTPAGALGDLQLAWRHLAPAGILAIDDYEHPRWPGVTEAVEAFLDRTPGVRVMADLNRHGAAGRKLYVCREAAA